MFLLTHSAVAFAKSPLIYFDTFLENRKAFVDLIQKADPKIWNLKTASWPLSGAQELSTDVAFFKNRTPQKTLLVISSGIHGIEGFVGSALQRWVIAENILAGPSDLKTDLAFIHILNPWGMQRGRRVDQKNVDLNRNFLIDAKNFQGTNADYLKIDSFLNPTDSLSLSFFHRLGFLFDSVQFILRYSLETLRKSILIGQSDQPLGLYFRGKEFASVKARVDDFLQNDCKTYAKIIWLDLHTGYGENKRLHFLANDADSPLGQRLVKQFGAFNINFGNQKNFYKTDGDLATYVSEKSSGDQEINGLVLEYGTLNSQSTLGSIESLRRMVIENQAFHHGGSFESLNESTRQFRQMFFPREDDWAEAAVTQTRQALLNLNLGMQARH
ncbi:MAG: DUF2817 domain-containing protein [Bdellovibrionaceae bacterium]|nr:DUF2817 domain-containing protein [Bdellovibrio sp.]